MQKSDSIGELAKALATAQGVIQGAKKDSENPFFKSKYADLASVWDACRPALSANGLAVIQTTEAEDENGSIPVETMLAHSSGEWICGLLKVRPMKDDPQAMGSALTYARRYALAAMVGVAPEDDDGNAGSHRNGQSEPAAREPRPKGKSAGMIEAETKALKQAIVTAAKTLNEMGDHDVADGVPLWGTKRVNDFSKAHFANKGVDDLDTAQLNEMAKLLCERMDAIKKTGEIPAASDGNAERDSLIAGIKSNFDSEKHLDTYLKEHKFKGTLDQLTTPQLKKIHGEVEVPF